MKNFLIIIFLLITTCVFAGQEPEFVYDEHGMRDPFWPLISPSGTIVSYGTDIAITDMVLEGIAVDSKGASSAIINGNVLKEHDHIGLYIVDKILTDQVILIKDQEKFTLHLHQGGE